MSPEHGESWFFVRTYELEPHGADVKVEIGEEVAFRWGQEKDRRIAFDAVRLRHMAPKVFLTHSSHDKPRIRELRDYLHKSGLRAWLDEIEIKVGDSIVQRITEGLSQTDFLVVSLSPAALLSRWVQRELDATLMEQLAGRQVTILPLLLEKCEIPFLLRDIYYADCTANQAKGFQDLVNSIKSRRYDL